MSLRFVLVRPRNPLNIGAAARAMANFGYKDLAVVKPFAPVWRETTSAPGAEDVVKEARALSSIDEAIADCHLVIGTTALRDRRPERPVVSLSNLADHLKTRIPSPLLSDDPPGFRTALLFGPEKTGLSGPYLERCHFWLTIPTDPSCPSMNLGQSVALCAYEWSRSVGGLDRRPLPGAGPTATQDDLRRLVQHAMDLFEAADYLPFLPRSAQERKIRRLFQRWRIHRQDIQLVHGLFRFLMQAISGRKPHETYSTKSARQK